MHSNIQVWTEIRRKVLVEKGPKRQICREYSINFHTVEKMLQNVEPSSHRAIEPSSHRAIEPSSHRAIEPSGYQERGGDRPRPRFGPFHGVIEEILRLDETAPRTERHTAKRVFGRLPDEHGYQGSESQVRRYLAESDHHHREVFVPLSQRPDEAQFDFGEVVVEIAGTRRKVAFAVMILSCSDAFFVSAIPRERSETFQRSHDDSFEFFGGVPPKRSPTTTPRSR